MEDKLRLSSIVSRGILSLLINKAIEDKLNGPKVKVDVLGVDVDHIDREFIGRLSISFSAEDGDILAMAKEAILK